MGYELPKKQYDLDDKPYTFCVGKREVQNISPSENMSQLHCKGAKYENSYSNKSRQTSCEYYRLMSK